MNGHIGCEGHKSQVATNFEKMFLPASVGGGQHAQEQKGDSEGRGFKSQSRQRF